MRPGGDSQLTRDLGRIFGGGVSPAGDAALLDGFARRSDAAAFEALVDRHGPMVRGVCRRILPDGHDADDAFQATFVVLLRKAGRVEHPDRLAPWLHGVASRVALKARARAARSRARLRVWTAAEADAAPAPPGPRADLGDVQALIDAKIAGLPAKLRGVVVLCLVEGTTYDEAARRLGCPIGTVQSRLSRGRDLLRARLTRRGIAPALALAAPDLVGPIPIPLALARRTLAVAAGRAVPPTLLALTRGVAPTMLSKPTILTTLLLGGVALAGGGLTLARSGPSAPAQDRGMMPAPPAGQPPRADAPPAQTPPKPADPVAITGRIIDLEGRPAAGIKVTPGSYQTFKKGDLALWLDATRQGRPPWVETPGLEVEWSQDAPEATRAGATTDVDGRFRLAGFGPEAIVALKLVGESIAFNTIDVATRPIPPTPAPGIANQYGPGTTTVYGSDFTCTAGPTRVVTGTIKDAQTGEPLAGAQVRTEHFAGSSYGGVGVLRATADAQGRFRLVGLPPRRPPGSEARWTNQILILPTDDQPYMMQEAEVPEPPGNDPVAVDVALRRGLWIEGKVTEQATGKPVPGVWMHYAPFLVNTYAQANPVFDRNGNTDGTSFQDRYKSRDDGSFRLVGLPGRALVGARSVNEKYLQGVGSESIAGMDEQGTFPTYRNPVHLGRLAPTAMKEIDPPADATVVRVDFELRVGPAVRIRVVGEAGQPLAGARTRGAGGRGSWDGEPMAAEGEVRNLMAGEERSVLLIHEGRRLGKVIRVLQGDDAAGPVTVRLEPLASLAGRVVAADAEPILGALIRADVRPGGDYTLSLPQVKTDERGRFVVPNVAVGCDYALVVEVGMLGRDRHYSYFEKATVRPGTVTELGDLRVKDD